MRTRGQLRIAPGTFGAGSSGDIELVVVHTRPDLTRAVVHRAAALTRGLNARLRLIAVHAVPCAVPFACHSAAHASLVEQLIELCSASVLPSTAHVVVADSRTDGFRQAIAPESTVLLSAREEALARALAEDGHQVMLIHVE